MGWEPRPPTLHKCDRPTEAQILMTGHRVGDLWSCDECKKRYVVAKIDHGHDVMPGEKTSTLRLIAL